VAAPRLELDHGRILLAGTVFIYLERTLAAGEPADNDEARVRSYGLAPNALAGEGEALAALFPGESVWLGFEAVDPERPVRLTVRAGDWPPLEAVVPPDHAVPGAFSRGELTVVTIGPVPAAATIRLVEPAVFTAATGAEPAPLDPESGFGGWRLP
jgi:hypothetical protein